jgi:3-methyladenine DNA glycosylase AlkD
LIYVHINFVRNIDLWSTSIESSHYISTKKVEKEYKYTFPIIKILISHKHDLIHKANGWMMREIYKRLDGKVVREFLKENYKNLPRTTLRYTIEKMNDLERKSWLRGEM